MSIFLPPPEPNPIAIGPTGSTGGGPFGPPGFPFTNPTITGLTYLGNAALERQVDLPIWETPFATDPKQYVYRVLYQVKASAFASMPQYQTGPYGGQHIGESDFKTSKGGILSFYREFARQPDSRNEFESYIHPYQDLTYGGVIATVPLTMPFIIVAVSDPVLTEFPITVTSRIQYDYFDTIQADQIPLPKAPRVLILNGVGYAFNEFLTLQAGDQFLAEDATLRIWKGRIYERRMRFIVFQRLSELV